LHLTLPYGAEKARERLQSTLSMLSQTKLGYDLSLESAQSYVSRV